MGRFEETQHHHDLSANVLLTVNNNKSFTNKLPKCDCKMKFVKTIKMRLLTNAEDVTRLVVRGTEKKETTDTNTNRHVKKLCIEMGEITN